MVNNSININKTNNYLSPHLKSLNTKKIMTYSVGNPDPGLGQPLKCVRFKPVIFITYFD